MEASLEVFRRLGATVVDIELPDFSRLSALAAVLHAAEANPFHDEWFRTRPQDYSPQVRERLEKGRPVLARDYLMAMQARAPAIAAFCEAVFSKVDLVHGPVVSFQTPTIAETDISSGEAAAEMLGRFVRLTRPISYLGLARGVRQRGIHQGRHADRHAAHRSAARRSDRATRGARLPGQSAFSGSAASRCPADLTACAARCACRAAPPDRCPPGCACLPA